MADMLDANILTQHMSGLKRELGKWDLTAIGVNQVIGGAVFLMAAPLAAQIGAWSGIAVAMVGVLSLLIALNFAEAGSRFEGTGGAYLYTRAAFGRFFSFEVGWMMWVTRVASWASVVNGLTTALAYYWPELGANQPGLAREAVITGVILTLMTINVIGIKQSAWVVNALTYGKLTPLVIFILLGLPYVSFDALRPDMALTWSQISTSALLLIFAYGGYEVVGVPAGETKNPKTAVPFAMVMTIVIVGIVMTLAQVVAMGTLPNIAASQRPLADASLIFLGAWGALLMTTGGAVSMTGNNMGQALSGSRNLYALAEQGDLPSFFGKVHAKFHTPATAIIITSLVALALALFGDFVTLAASSAVSRLLVYAGTCASVLVLRRQGPAAFTIPGGPVVPVIALVISLAILGGATSLQLQVGGYALVAGAVLYVIARRGAK
ncbi:MAG: amino acid permease [Acidobacteria bacterium]|nr:amino acid permease [Acidobacteriota bacterium]